MMEAKEYLQALAGAYGTKGAAQITKVMLGAVYAILHNPEYTIAPETERKILCVQANWNEKEIGGIGKLPITALPLSRLQYKGTRYR